MIKYNIVGNIESFDFSVNKLIKKILKTTYKIVGKEKKDKQLSKHIVSYIFVDINEIHRINKEYRQIDRPTDVISFAYGDTDNETGLPYELGDVFICVEKVFEQAKEYNHTNLRECGFLITHGILHLLGYDHMNPEDEAVMFELQKEILERLKITR